MRDDARGLRSLQGDPLTGAPEIPDGVELSSAFLGASASEIWRAVSDPGHWPRIYGSWIATIEPSGDHEFWIAESRAGEYFNVYAVLDEPTGTADFELVDELGMSSFFRTRVLPVPTGGCLVVQVASRPQGGAEDDWQSRARALRDDLGSLADNL